tara:strand:+ start:6196 stop:6483 length:288 start_codon:yes stop_codon:yes gene_type:complete
MYADQALYKVVVMGDIKEFISEKTINYWIRFVLRLMAWVTLMFYMVYRIIIPVINKEPLYLDSNDGWVMLGSISLLLAIEGVKMAVDRWVNSKAK